MFSGLISWLKKAFDDLNGWWSEFFKGAWDALKGYISSAWAIGVTVMGFFVWCFNTLKDAVVQLWQSLGSLSTPDIDVHAPGGITWMLDFANTLFPLAELCSFLVAYAVLRLALTLYRVVKSWIPTLS